MTVSSDDWRRMGQEKFLPSGTTWVHKRYRAESETWEHEHCEFCAAKFMDPDYSDQHRQAIANDPRILTEGFTTTGQHPKGPGYYWVCANCFGDFAEELGWRTQTS
ncbi:MAG TPA: hypothetical protein VKA36_00065 [Solirubrobacterales bacterium]|nr:hypothetical protein [Solirubrobacterales bacterium]